MDWTHLLLDLPAIIGASSMISLLSPWRMQPRAVPALLFIIGLIVMLLPMLPVVALALMLPAALIQKYLGIDLHGHEPLNAAPAVETAKSAAQSARERVRKPKRAEVTEFVTKAYPAPGDAAELDDDAADDPGDPTASTPDTGPSAAEQLQAKLAAVTADPRLPAGAAARLAGRPGLQRDGLHSQHAPVRSFVPAI